LPQATIRGLAEDASGELWISTQAGVWRYDRERAAAIPLPASLGAIAGGDNGPLFRGRDGSLWVGSGRGVELLDPAGPRGGPPGAPPPPPLALPGRGSRACSRTTRPMSPACRIRRRPRWARIPAAGS
jgi:hypothetical protein